MADIRPLSPINPQTQAQAQTQAHSQNILPQNSKQKTNPVSVVEPSKNLVVDAQANSTTSEQPNSTRLASVVSTITTKMCSTYKTLFHSDNASGTTNQIPTDLQLNPITIIDNNADNSMQNIFNLGYTASTITLGGKKIKKLLDKLKLEINCLKRLFPDDFSLSLNKDLEIFLPSINIDQIKKVASIYKELQSFLISQDADKYLDVKEICKDVEEYFDYLQLGIITQITTQSNIQELNIECFNSYRHDICMSLVGNLESKYNTNKIFNTNNTAIEQALINILQTITFEIKNSNRYSEHYLTKWFDNEKLAILKYALDKTSIFLLEKSFYSSTVVISLYYLIGYHEEVIRLIKNKALNFEKETIADFVYGNYVTDTIDNFVSFFNYNMVDSRLTKYLDCALGKNNKKSFFLNSSTILISLKQVAEQVFSYWFTGVKEKNDNPDAILNYIANYSSSGTTKNYTEVCSPIIKKLSHEFSLFNNQLYIMIKENNFRPIFNYKYINFLIYREKIDELSEVVDKIKKHLDNLQNPSTKKKDLVLNKKQTIKLLDCCCKTKHNLEKIEEKIALALLSIDKSCKKSMAILYFDEKKFIKSVCINFRILNKETPPLIKSQDKVKNDKNRSCIEIILDNSLHDNSEKNVFAINTSAIPFRKKENSGNIDIENIKEYFNEIANELSEFIYNALDKIKIDINEKENKIKCYMSENDMTEIKKIKDYEIFLRNNLERNTKKFLLQNNAGSLISLHGKILLAILEKQFLVYKDIYNQLLPEKTAGINFFNAHKSNIISIINDYSNIREQSNISEDHYKLIPCSFYNNMIIIEIIQIKQSANEVNSFLYTLRNNHNFKDSVAKNIKRLTESLLVGATKNILFLQEIITCHILTGNYGLALNISQKYMEKTKDTTTKIQDESALKLYVIRLNSIVKYTLKSIEGISAANKNKIFTILKVNKQIIENISNNQDKIQIFLKLLQNRIDQLQLDITNIILESTLEAIEEISATNKNKILAILKANKQILENISNPQDETQSIFKLLQNKIGQLQLEIAEETDKKTRHKTKAQQYSKVEALETEESTQLALAALEQKDRINCSHQKSDKLNDQKQSKITSSTEPQQQQQKKQFPTDEDISFPIDAQLNYLVVDNHDTPSKKSNKKISNKRKSILNKKNDDKRATNNLSTSKDIILEPVITDTIQIGNSTEIKPKKLKNPKNNPIQNIPQATPNLSQTILDQLGNQLKASTKINNNEPIPVFNNQEESSYLNKDEDLVNNNISETNSATKKKNKKKKKKKKKEETVPNVITPATDNAPINSSNHVTKMNSNQATINEFQKVIESLYEDNIIKSLRSKMSLKSSYQDPVVLNNNELDYISSVLLDNIARETTLITSKVDYLYNFIIKLEKYNIIYLQVSKNQLHKLVAELFIQGIDNRDNITSDNTTNNNADNIIKLGNSKKRLVTEQQILEFCKLSKLEFIDDINYKVTADNLGELRPVTSILKKSDSTDSSLLDIDLFTANELKPINSRYRLSEIIQKHSIPEEKNTFSYYVQKCNNYLIDNLNYLDHLLDISDIIVDGDTGNFHLQKAVINQFNKVTNIHNHLKVIANQYAAQPDVDLKDPTFLNSLLICKKVESLFLTCQMGVIKIMISDKINNKQEILYAQKKYFLNICLVWLSRVKNSIATDDTYLLNLSATLDTIINLVATDFITAYHQEYLVDRLLAESKIFEDAITKLRINLCVIPYDLPTIEFSKLSLLERSAGDKLIYHHEYKISDFNNCMRLVTSCLLAHNYWNAEHALDEHIRELEKIISPSNEIICYEKTINTGNYISAIKNYFPIINQYIALANLSNTNQEAFISFLNKFSKIVLMMRSYYHERKNIYNIKCIMESLPTNRVQEITEESYYQAIASIKIEQNEFRNDISQLSISEIKQCLYFIAEIRAMLVDIIATSNSGEYAEVYKGMKIPDLIDNNDIVKKYLARVVGTIFNERDQSIAEYKCYIDALNRIFKLYYGYLLENYPILINNELDLSDAKKITEEVFTNLCHMLQ